MYIELVQDVHYSCHQEHPYYFLLRYCCKTLKPADDKNPVLKSHFLSFHSSIIWALTLYLFLDKQCFLERIEPYPQKNKDDANFLQGKLLLSCILLLLSNNLSQRRQSESALEQMI